MTRDKLIQTCKDWAPAIVSGIVFLCLVVYFESYRDRQQELVNSTVLRASLEILSIDRPTRAIVVSDFQGEVIELNKRAEDYYGLRIGDHIERLIPERLRQQHAKDFDKGVEKAKSSRRVDVVHVVVCPAIRADGLEEESQVKIFTTPTGFVTAVESCREAECQ